MNIVFYDGDCGLCQRSIRFLVKADGDKKLLFAPLNGETFKNIYGLTLVELKTVLFYSENKTFEKSDAIIEIGRILGGKYKWLCLIKIIPRKIRDFFYDLLARKRTKFSCVLISRDERFLN